MRGPRSGLYSRLSPIQPAGFEEIIAAHEAFVAGRPAGGRKLPRFIMARRMKVDGRKIPDIDFTGSDLEGCSFVRTDLSRALFCGAALNHCDFTHAVLTGADLRGAAFEGARLNFARMEGADMRAAVLCHRDGLTPPSLQTGASARGAMLDSGRFDELEAQAVDFANSSMRGAVLRNANLKGARFANCNLDGAEFRGARVAGADFRGAILTNVDLADIALPRDALAGCLVDPSPEALARAEALKAALEDAEAWAQTGGRKGQPADVSGHDLRPLHDQVKGRALPALNGRKACGVGLNFSNAVLVAANFEGADLRGANFTGADLRGANFRDANLAHARFRDADLGPLDLASGGARAVEFTGATLDGADVAPVMMI